MCVCVYALVVYTIKPLIIIIVLLCLWVIIDNDNNNLNIIYKIIMKQ